MLTRTSSLKRTAELRTRTPMKRRRESRNKSIAATLGFLRPLGPVRVLDPDNSGRYLQACRGHRCYLVVPGVCSSYPGDPTVVPCHSNQAKHGKGMAHKALHKFTVPGCMACHAWIDQGPASKEEKFALWDAAYARWEPVRDMSEFQSPVAFGAGK